MTVIAHAPALPRPDVWHRRFGPALALGLVVLPFAAALAWAATRPQLDQATIAAEIRTTAALVDDHAAGMIRIGEKVSTAAATSSAADRAAWVAYGQHMVSDGQSLKILGERLRETATVAEADPLHANVGAGSVAVRETYFQARWEQLRADGRAMAEHGRLMIQMARDMTAGASSGIISEADAQEIALASAGMAEAGDRTVRSAELLLASMSQTQRGMGLGR